MTTYISTPQTPNGYTITTSDFYIFDPAATVFHDDGSGIIILDGAAEMSQVQITGLVASGSSNGAGIRSDGGDVIQISASATVVSEFDGLGSNGISVNGVDTQVFNAGYISGAYGVFGSFGSAQGLEVTNSGTIAGRRFGVSSEGGDGFVANSGTITSDGVGVMAFQGGITIDNSGTIRGGGDGNGGTGAAVFFDTDAGDPDATLINSGTISAEVHPTTGLKIAVLDAEYTTGSVLTGTEGVLNIYNSGAIEGDVLLFGGDDSYRGSGDGVVMGTVSGGDGNDTLIGTQVDDVFEGGDDDDIIDGKGGDDLIDGGDGFDYIKGGDGNDDIVGEGGKDTIKGGSGDDLLDGGNADDMLKGNAGQDELIGGKGLDSLWGHDGDDTLEGGDQNDVLYGGGDNDILSGGAAKDSLYGGTGDDILNGDNSDDLLNGGNGDDELTGGNGADVFEFNRHAGNDIVTDFEDGIDDIDLSAFNFASTGAAKAIATDFDGGVLFDLALAGGSGTIFIENITKADINGSDLIL